MTSPGRSGTTSPTQSVNSNLRTPMGTSCLDRFCALFNLTSSLSFFDTFQNHHKNWKSTIELSSNQQQEVALVTFVTLASQNLHLEFGVELNLRKQLARMMEQLVVTGRKKVVLNLLRKDSKSSFHHRYFKCEPNHGLFVPESKVALSPLARKARMSRANSQESLASNLTLGSLASTNTSKLRMNATQKVQQLGYVV
jgi:hypothetical protein